MIRSCIKYSVFSPLVVVSAAVAYDPLNPWAIRAFAITMGYLGVLGFVYIVEDDDD